MLPVWRSQRENKLHGRFATELNQSTEDPDVSTYATFKILFRQRNTQRTTFRWALKGRCPGQVVISTANSSFNDDSAFMGSAHGKGRVALIGITQGFQGRSQSDTEFLHRITDGKFATKHLKSACTGATGVTDFTFIKARLKRSQNFF